MNAVSNEMRVQINERISAIVSSGAQGLQMNERLRTNSPSRIQPSTLGIASAKAVISFFENIQ